MNSLFALALLFAISPAHNVGVVLADSLSSLQVGSVTPAATLREVDGFKRMVIENIQHAGSGQGLARRRILQICTEASVVLDSRLHRDLAAKAAGLTALDDQRPEHHSSRSEKPADQSAKKRCVSPIHAFWIAFVAAFVTAVAPGLSIVIFSALLNRYGHRFDL